MLEFFLFLFFLCAFISVAASLIVSAIVGIMAVVWIISIVIDSFRS